MELTISWLPRKKLEEIRNPIQLVMKNTLYLFLMPYILKPRLRPMLMQKGTIEKMQLKQKGF